jgi:hypothetical protein
LRTLFHTRLAQASKEAEIARDQKPTLRAAVLDGEQRQLAMKRFTVLQPHLEKEVPLARVAEHAGVPICTAQRWLARYRELGLAGLVRAVRGDAGVRRLPGELVALVEGMALVLWGLIGLLILGRMENASKPATTTS